MSSFRKYSSLTTNCKCAMEHQIFYQEESENFPNFHQSAAGSRHMVEPVVQCVDGMNHCHMPPCETSPAPAWLTWKPLVHFSSCCWRKLDDNRARDEIQSHMMQLWIIIIYISQFGLEMFQTGRKCKTQFSDSRTKESCL